MIITNAVGERQVVYQLGETLEQIKIDVVRVTLENNHWNPVAAGRVLRVTDQSIRNWIARYDIRPDDPDLFNAQPSPSLGPAEPQQSREK